MTRRATLLAAAAVAVVGLVVAVGLDLADGEGGDRTTGSGGDGDRTGVARPGGPPCVVAVTTSDPGAPGGGVYHVATVAPDGTTTQLGGDEVTHDPVISPDGQRIAYVRAVGDYESAGPEATEVWTMGIDGSDPAPVPTDGAFHRSPAWSPDGTRLAFVRAGERGLDELVTVPVTGGPADVVFRPRAGGLGVLGAADWSPDGTRLAHLWYPAGLGHPAIETEVRTVSVDGGDPEVVATFGHARSPDWHPDGSAILVSATGPLQPPPTGAEGELEPVLAVVDVATGDVRSVADGMSDGRWSADGTRTIGIRVGRTGDPSGSELVEVAIGPVDSEGRVITAVDPGGSIDVGPGC